MFELRDALGWLSSGRLLGAAATPVTAVCTDSRALVPGCLFVALRGDRFDAHAFVAAAFDGGAAAVMVERPVAGLREPALIVADTRRAYGEIAAGWRRRFDLPVIGVTGSNGKTTVKTMLAAILATAFGEAGSLATEGNLNNEIGVPATVLRLGPAHRAAVIELGMNHPGEIAWVAQIAAPTIALVNNAQREHQEFLGSVRATAIENGAAIEALPGDGVAVFPGDDTHTPLWRGLAGARRCLVFGQQVGCDVFAEPEAQPGGFTIRTPGGTLPVALAIDGAHNVRNALAATACALAAGIDPACIVAGLAAFRPARGRMARVPSASGATLIDDSYNANPDSVRAAIDVLAVAPGPRVLLLGDMGEVGDEGPRFHDEVIAYAAGRGLDHLLGLGEAVTRAIRRAPAPGFEAFDAHEALIARAAALAHPGATLLVKGSRFMRMERVVAALAADGAVPGGH